MGDGRGKDAVRKLTGPVHVDEKNLRGVHGELMAKIFSHQIDDQIQERSSCAASHDITFINDDLVFTQPREGKSLFELVGKIPMSGRLLAVENTSCPQNKCAGAKAGNVGTVLKTFSQPGNVNCILLQAVFNLLV